jgi:hypothetical protein
LDRAFGLQHECELPIPILPQSFFICRQQAFSVSVSCPFGAKHAIAEADGNITNKIEATILTAALISRKYSRRHHSTSSESGRI